MHAWPSGDLDLSLEDDIETHLRFIHLVEDAIGQFVFDVSHAQQTHADDSLHLPEERIEELQWFYGLLQSLVCLRSPL